MSPYAHSAVSNVHLYATLLRFVPHYIHADVQVTRRPQGLAYGPPIAYILTPEELSIFLEFDKSTALFAEHLKNTWHGRVLVRAALGCN